MPIQDTIFLLFGLFCVLCAVGVVFARSAIYSAFCLVLCFFSLASLYLFWGAPFLAAVQVLIYTGAIVVLFVFVVMLLDLGTSAPVTPGHWSKAVVAGLVSWVFALLCLRALNRSLMGTGSETVKVATDLKSVATLLFTEYLWPFEILSVFLLALIVAVYALARPNTPDEERRAS